MGLPARQRRVLERIESTLRGSDPRLAALYAIFAKLTRDEEMPRIEQLRQGASVLFARLRLVSAAVLARLHIPIGPRQRAALFFPLAIALAAVSIVFAVRSGPGSGCTPVRTVAAAKYTAKSRLCRAAPTVTPLNFGH
jgi:hypothetical protein